MKKKHVALVLFGAFVAFSLGYVLGQKSRSGTFAVLNAQGSGGARTQNADTSGEVKDQTGEEASSPAVPSPSSGVDGEASGSSAVADTPLVTGDVRINVNTATVEQLVDLPGVGPVLARRIVDYRDQHGSFADGDDLMEVKGIGNAIWGDIEEFVRFE